uniref:Protein B n=1 Tax=Acetobacter pasteurianus TaxID=438 RepID=Q44129_ACEPA|nr:protein B [Acetobacter pasteurianus]
MRPRVPLSDHSGVRNALGHVQTSIPEVLNHAPNYSRRCPTRHAPESRNLGVWTLQHAPRVRDAPGGRSDPRDSLWLAYGAPALRSLSHRHRLAGGVGTAQGEGVCRSSSPPARLSLCLDERRARGVHLNTRLSLGIRPHQTPESRIRRHIAELKLESLSDRPDARLVPHAASLPLPARRQTMGGTLNMPSATRRVLRYILRPAQSVIDVLDRLRPLLRPVGGRQMRPDGYKPMFHSRRPASSLYGFLSEIHGPMQVRNAALLPLSDPVQAHGRRGNLRSSHESNRKTINQPRPVLSSLRACLNGEGQREPYAVKFVVFDRPEETHISTSNSRRPAATRTTF